MNRFKKILVGVDISAADRYVSAELSGPDAEAVRQALWLAQLNSASIDFLFSMELSAKAQEVISESSIHEPTVLGEAMSRMAALEEEARAVGVKARSHVVIGKCWLELIRQVLRNEHDLVVVGTHPKSALKGFFLSSTVIKLLRKCPCAVWITHSRDEPHLDSILVAHDLRPVGDFAMQLGCSMASLQDAQLHVVHAAEHLEFDYLFPANGSEQHKQTYGAEAREHIEAQLVDAKLQHPARMHFVIDSPMDAIMNCIQEHNIDLLVMGTLGHTGIPGFFTGSTAEQLLPRIPCSLLAVKPPGFQSPVSLTSA